MKHHPSLVPFRPARRSCLLALVVLAAPALLPPARLAAQGVGALGNPTGKPIGGGEGYGDWIVPRRTNRVVATRAELLAALASATPGTVVYVRDDAEIDLSNDWWIEIRAGVTLASGRGRNGSLGALIRTRATLKAPLFQVSGSDVRITGLRLRGPDTEIEPTVGPWCGAADATGIAVRAVEPTLRYVRIDNNELFGWPDSAVKVENVYGVQVQHNHIHHNRRQMRRDGCRAYGLGYGVVVGGAGHALVEANEFDHNRHDIACDGMPNTGYEARYNLILGGAVQHSFDVHGGADRGDGTSIAGAYFYVHHNTFLQAHKPAFRIRGVPLVGAVVTANEFRHGSESSAADQVNATGNFSRFGNAVGVDRFPAWFVSFSGTAHWRLRRFEARGVRDVAWGDFDGDGTTDAFLASGGRWYVSFGARSAWTQVNASTVPFSALRFGDFDGDRRTDVFRTDGSSWWVSYGATGPWTRLNASTIALDKLAFADFDGDGRCDVFYANGSTWYVSRGGVGLWQPLQASPLGTSGLRFGDFNGDRRADVFRTDGSSWWVSFGGTGPWTRINSSVIPLGSLAFGDFDGDGRTDVFYANGSVWQVSYGGVTTWQHLVTSDLTVPSLAFGDFNGDGRTDVLSRQHP